MSQPASQALIAVTFDVEMCRNFPTWEGTDHWDYRKAEIDEATKAYTLAAAKRLKARGGRLHCFVLGRTLEQDDIEWLLELLDGGHRVANHTYDHINLMANTPENLQSRFQRSPWLVKGRRLMEVIEENIQMTSDAMEMRLGIRPTGFRAPYSFENGLTGREDLQELVRRCDFGWVSTRYPSHPIDPPGVEPEAQTRQGIVEAQARAQPFHYANSVVEIPMSPISDIFAFRNGRWSLEWYRQAIGQAVLSTIDSRGVFDFLGHPACMLAMDGALTTIDLICDLVEEAGGRARFADLDEIASRVTAAPMASTGLSRPA